MLASGCTPSSDISEPDDLLLPEERFLVEQYMRIVEARRMAAAGDEAADSLFAVLAEEIPVDSLLALGDRISAQEPGRWPFIFEEIVARKRNMEDDLR